MPALARAPGWRLEADVRRDGRVVTFRVRGAPRGTGSAAPVGAESQRARYDSEWERSLATEFRARMKRSKGEWVLSREGTPVAFGNELFLPDFTLRHHDGREALVEIVGFWTPEYLEEKMRKVRHAGLANLVLVVYRGLAVGSVQSELESLVGAEQVVWFAAKPKAADVLAAVERCATLALP